MKTNLAEDIIPVSEFRQKTSSYLKDIHDKGRTMVLTQNGHSAAVVMSPETFEQLQYERNLFASIARGEKDAEEGKVTPHAQAIKDLRKLVDSL